MPSYTKAQLRRLDAAVAEARGFKRDRLTGDFLDEHNYTESIDDAMELVEEMLADGWRIRLSGEEDDWGVCAYRGDPGCPYQKEYDPVDGHGFSSVEVYPEEDGVPLEQVITLAYLRAQGLDPDEIVKGGDDEGAE